MHLAFSHSPLQVFTEMQKAGVKPNAVTYGIYNRVSLGGGLKDGA